jgi:DNA-binding NarL/FixJ family response regulator
MSIRILLVDDHHIFREGLRSLLASQPDFTILGEAPDGREAVRLAKELQPDLVIMDVSMPLLSGTEATRQVISACPKTKVLCLSMFEDRRFVTAALEAGATGYILKDCKFDEFVEAIKSVHANETYLCPRVTQGVLNNYKSGGEEPSSAMPPQLSPREREVVQLIAEGFSTREIAEQLHVSIKTVNTHREHIFEKLKIDNLAALIKYTIKEGIISL